MSEKSAEPTVYCPVLKRQVNGTDCGDLAFISEGIEPKSFLPDGIKPEEFTEEMRRTCLACEWHW